jgi:phosphohistidine phosphatase
MKTIYLVRHAKAVRDDIAPDIERPLDDQGREEALQIASGIKGEAIPDLLVSSPAARALETAGIFAGELGYPLEKIARRKALYDQNANVFRAVLREMKDSCERIMLFGHNPSITDAARTFAPDFHDEIPTTGAVTIVFDIASWKEIAEGGGKLMSVRYPKETVKMNPFRHMKKNLTVQLAEHMECVLAEHDRVIAEEIRDTVHRAGEKIAGKFVKRLKANVKESKAQSPKQKAKKTAADETSEI